MALEGFEKYQFDNLMEHLRQIYPNELDMELLETLKKNISESNQELPYITREVTNLFKRDNDKLQAFLEKYQVGMKEKEVDQVQDEVKQTLNMKDVTDFTKDGKTYIKITYEDGNVQIIENRNHKDTKQIFEDVQKLKAIINTDGTKSAEEIFQELLQDYIEVPMKNSTNINQDNLKIEEQKKLRFLEMSFPQNKVLASPQDNIFIVEGNPTITVTVVDKNGEYEIKQLQEAGYPKEEREPVNVIHNEISLPKQDMSSKIFGYSMEQLDVMMDGMSEEEICQYLRLHGKNPQQIIMILLSLEEYRSQKKEKVDGLEPAKQKILVAPKRNPKMAAFINTLTLAFLVGMFSGILFFAMLRIVLHSF